MADAKGRDAILSYGGQGVSASTYVAIGNVKDVSHDLTATTIDATTRDDEGWTNNRKGLKSATITFNLKRDTTDATQSALEAAYYSDTIRVWLKDKLSSNSSKGFSGLFEITSWNIGEPVDDMQMIDVTAVNAGKITRVV